MTQSSARTPEPHQSRRDAITGEDAGATPNDGAGADVAVIATGAANIASMLAALRRAGAAPRVVEHGDGIDASERVVLPGVGSFGAAMTALRRGGFIDPLRARIAAGRPTLAVCVGLQVLCRASEESPVVEGLGIWNLSVGRYAGAVRVPQFGWNRVNGSACSSVVPGYAYFANSYRLSGSPGGWETATSEYGGTFVAAAQRGAVLACQFHPELSGAWGAALLRRWLTQSKSGEVAGC